ncbi:MAG: acetyl-CoA carboxylase carboxyl transferase subunit alpha [Acidobacteria bacterium]|nr:MAG: acetyl-CoA carboxylase carboxyl transferase subunit alpha [Acidobacteriota bacterium]
MGNYNFEAPIVELLKEIEQLSVYPDHPEAPERLAKMKDKLARFRREIYSNLSPWEITMVARHPQRPHTLDYVDRLFPDFIELHGDRKFSDDKAIVGGMATFEGIRVVVIGHQKGRDSKQRIYRNFGMPHPEGYRKALRLMKLAEKFGLPVITLIDTTGAYPGVGAEERGQSEAIAMNLREMARLKIPTIAVVIGEGGSGGALALGVTDRVLMLQYSIYSVISPEGCASILWKDAGKAEDSAENLHLTAPDLKNLGLIDEIISEPHGAAHANWDEAAELVRVSIRKHLDEIKNQHWNDRTHTRYDKFRKMGFFQLE